MSVILIRTVIVFSLLTLAMRLTGKRQIGELEVSELITTLLLSELAASPIADNDIPLLHSIVPIFFLAALEVVLTFFTARFPAFKRVVDGRPAVVIRQGHIDQRELERARMSAEELLGQLRRQGIGDPRDVKYALFEQDGQLSVFENNSPSGHILNPLVANGHICKCSLEVCGKSEKWVRSQVGDIRDVFLFAVDEKGGILYIRKDIK